MPFSFPTREVGFYPNPRRLWLNGEPAGVSMVYGALEAHPMNAFAPVTSPPSQSHALRQAFDQVMADEFALSTATRDYHWTVRGPHFRNLCELFDEQFRQINFWMERIADRAKALGWTLQTGWAEMAARPRFSPTSGVDLNAQGMLLSLISMHRTLAECIRGDLDRLKTETGAPLVSVLSGLLEYHETTAWLLEELVEDRELAQA
jgi:starvation-inducible DNA-binding protein